MRLGLGPYISETPSSRDFRDAPRTPTHGTLRGHKRGNDASDSAKRSVSARVSCGGGVGPFLNTPPPPPVVLRLERRQRRQTLDWLTVLSKVWDGGSEGGGGWSGTPTPPKRC